MVSAVCSRRGHLQALSAQHPATEPAQTSMPGQALSTIPDAFKAPAPMSTLVSVDLASVQPKKMRKAARNPNWDAAQAPVRLYYRSLCAYHDPYLTIEAEDILGITIVPLDLSSGYMSDGGPRFIEPASSIDMASFVDRNQPWEDAPLEPIGRGDHDHPRNLEGKPWAEDVKLHEGRFMLGALRAFGHTPYDDDDDLPAFNNEWVSDFGDWSRMQEADSEDLRLWVLDSIVGSVETHRPHVQAFLNHGIPLVEDKLTTGEMTVATGIISNRRCFQGFNDHRYIHATIFSASFRDMRVIQVWHDREEPSVLHVRRSPIMDFMEGEKAKRDDWITLLCWMMGDQLDPMSNQASEMGKSQEKQPASGQPATNQLGSNQLGSNHSDSSHSDNGHSDSNPTDSNESDGSFYDHAEDTPCANQDMTPSAAQSPSSTT